MTLDISFHLVDPPLKQGKALPPSEKAGKLLAQKSKALIAYLSGDDYHLCVTMMCSVQAHSLHLGVIVDVFFGSYCELSGITIAKNQFPQWLGLPKAWAALQAPPGLCSPISALI